jgi:DNA-binding NtrC family response regulator
LYLPGAQSCQVQTQGRTMMSVSACERHGTAAGYVDFSEFLEKYPRAAVLSKHLQGTCEALAQLTDIPVFVHGESGTGKGVLAKEIASCRRQREGDIPFVALNCAVLNNDVADVVLFGNRRGAFTGAHETAIGAVGEADGGILFFDEIHCLSISTQRKLLRLLDEGAYTRVGEATERRARFQLIVASNRDVSRLVARGEFLLDLFMRVQGIEIAIPPLRERKEEIPDLMALYFATRQLSIRRDDFNNLVAMCLPLHWPGNVRQLYKALDAMRFNALIEGGFEYASHFVVNSKMGEPTSESDDGAQDVARTVHCRAQDPESADAAPLEGEGKLIDEAIREILRVRERPIDVARLVELVEASLIRYALSRYHSIKAVMDHLGLTRGKLDFKRRKYNLMAPGERDLALPERNGSSE